MAEGMNEFVDITKLRIGMYVHLDLSWMSHPFPSGSFKISNQRQIDTIRTLGLQRVRWDPAKSDPDPAASAPGSEATAAAAAAAQAQSGAQAQVALAREQAARRRAQAAERRRVLAQCEEHYSKATRVCVGVLRGVGQRPELARQDAEVLIHSMVSQLTQGGESMVHLLSEGAGERAAQHPVNVTVLSLLLGRSMGLDDAELRDLGLAALVHDCGKELLPQRVRWADAALSSTEDKAYRSHVGLSVDTGRRMGLAAPILQAMAQHHEYVDGSGFPDGLKGPSLGRSSNILALVNRYDNLCNPVNPATSLTPHEALAMVFSVYKHRFEGVALNAFVRLMGVYPPGSVVQLADDRYGMVMTVNSTRPLRPQILLYDSSIPRDEAPVVDMETLPQVGIKRSLKPAQLPDAVASYLSPRKRTSYYFEQVDGPPSEKGGL